MSEMRRDSGFSVRGRGCRTRAGFIGKESRREEWPLQGVFTLHVTDLQQRLASRADVYRIYLTWTTERPTLCFPPSHFGHDGDDWDDDQERRRLSARSDCHSSRSPEAAKHVPLTLLLLDDNCLIYCTLPRLTSLPSSPPPAIHDVHDGQPLRRRHTSPDVSPFFLPGVQFLLHEQHLEQWQLLAPY